MAGTSSEMDTQHQIRFVTKQEQYAVPNIPYAVPSSINCNNLNELVNELLKESTSQDKVVDFDFLIGGELLRVPLSEHLREQEVSSEEVVEVEYVERFPAPEPQDCLEHDDWVSATQTAGSWILSGCYDSTLHLWSSKGKHRLTIPGHSGAVKAVAWVNVGDPISSFVSVSQDQTAMIWEWNQSTNAVECIHVCRGHERGLECVGVDSSRSLFATGGWDTVLNIWQAGLQEGENEDGSSASKKMKLDKGKSEIKTPLIALKGHKEAISAVQWTEDAELCTASWDHTLKLWDGELGGIKSEIAGNKSFFDVAWSPLSRTLLTASADRHVRMYDPRSTEGSIVKSTFTSHTQWVQAVSWSTTLPNLFISGAYDNQLKLWDTRSPKAPLFDLTGHQDKVLCCDWSNPELMVSGGADNSLRVFKSKQTNKT